MFFKSALVSLVAAAALGSTANAATVVVNVTHDLTTTSLTNTFTLSQVLATPITLSEGDILDLRLDFLGNQTLVANSFTDLDAWLFTNNNLSLFTTTAALIFNDPTGPLGSPTDTESNGAAHIGNRFGASQLTTAPGPISFSGLRMQAHVDDFVDDGSHTYFSSFFRFTGSGFSVGSVQSGVPEPSTWATMLMGFFVVGAAMRKAKRRTSLLAARA